MKNSARHHLLALLAVPVIILSACSSSDDAGSGSSDLAGLGGSTDAGVSAAAGSSDLAASSSSSASTTSGASPESVAAESDPAESDPAESLSAESAPSSEVPVADVPAPAAEQAVEAAAPAVQLTLFSLGSNIRQGPSTDTAVVGSAYFGEEITVIESGADWYQLADGRGFVSATLVSTDPPAPAPVAAAAAPAAPPAVDPQPADAAAPNVAAPPAPAPVPAPAPAGSCPANSAACSYEQGGDFGIISAINAERTAAGLPTLSSAGSAGSQACALASAKAGSLNHCGYEALWGGTFVPDAGSVVAAWMNSSGHRAMLLDPKMTSVAVGFATRSDQYTVVAATFSR